MKVDKAHQQALVNTDARYSIAAYVGKHGWINFDASGPVDWDAQPDPAAGGWGWRRGSASARTRRGLRGPRRCN